MRHLAFAAVCGTLVLAACSDQTQSPNEPSVRPPSENFGTTCPHGRYPFWDVAAFIAPVFPVPPSTNKALKAEALVRVGAIALAWDLCQDRLARQIALKTIDWIDHNVPSSTAREALKAAILNGFGAGAENGDFVTGLFIPGDPSTEQVFETSGHDALIALKGNAFDKPTIITIRRLSRFFRLQGFPPEDQREPFYDFDATNSSTDNTVATHTPTPGSVVMAFCFEPVTALYGGNAGAQIGHNPVGGGFEFVPEVFNRSDLTDQLDACPPPSGPALRMGSPDGGLRGFTSFLASIAKTLFLPAPLQAAMVGGRGPIAGLPPSLSSFGLVLPNCTTYYNYSFCQYGGLF